MNERILVVEDDAALRRSEAVFLSRFGFDVMEAADGAEALEIFKKTSPMAVIMDGKMPVMDGFEACRALRAQPEGKAMPILMVTGMNETQAIEQAYSAGATDFILKPVNLNVLAHRLRHMIENGRLQNALSSTRSTLETFFGSIPSAVIFCNKSWEIIEVNSAAERLFGWNALTMVGLPARALFAKPADAENFLNIFTDGRTLPLGDEISFSNAAERPFWGELLGAKVGGKQLGGPEVEEGYVMVISDATERRRHQEEREKTAKLDLLGLLAGGIAHDFNNILTAVFSSLELARMELPENSPAAGYLVGAQPALDQARRLSQQLLTFSKGGQPVRKICDVEKIIRQTVEFSLRGAKLAAVFDIEDRLWPANVDEGQIGQVIGNLVVNAAQACPNGGRLWVSASNVTVQNANVEGLNVINNGGNYLKISLRDEGCGIPDDLRERIFDPYFTTKKTGNGLGLATVLSIIKRHGGSISVASAQDKGTTFTIHLPAEALKARVEFLPRTTVLPATNFRGKTKVLLLEDQPLIRVSAGKLLERCGCEVMSFETGREAVEAYRANKNFDMAILDMTLPGGMSGLEVFRELKAMNPQLYAVVSTGYADDPVMAEPERYGFRAVLPKPYTFEALQSLVTQAALAPR